MNVFAHDGGWTRMFMGVASFAGGQFVLMSLVADRLVPLRNRRPALVLQGVAAGAFVCSLLLVGLLIGVSS